MLNDITYDLPNGPKNLAPLFTTIDWRLIGEYYLELYDDQNNVICTTPVNKVTNEWAMPKIIRVHFLNYNGRYDSVTFQEFAKSDDVKSDTWTRPIPVSPLKTDGGMGRSNVRAQDSYQCKTYGYKEEDQTWLEQLLESPLAFVEWKGIEGQADQYLPITIIDKKSVTSKPDERYVYELSLEFMIANEKIGLRT